VEEVAEADISIPEPEVVVDVVSTDRRAGLAAATGEMARGVLTVAAKSSVEARTLELKVSAVSLSVSWNIVSAGRYTAVCFLRGGGWRECVGVDWGGSEHTWVGGEGDGEGEQRSSSLTILRSDAGMPLMLPLPLPLLLYTLGVAPLYTLPLCILPFDIIPLDPSCADDTTLGAGESVRPIGDPLLLTFKAIIGAPIPIFIKLCPTVPKLSSAYSPSPSDNDGERDRGPKMPLMVFVVEIDDLAECVCTFICELLLLLLLSLLTIAAGMLPMRFECRGMECIAEDEPEPETGYPCVLGL